MALSHFSIAEEVLVQKWHAEGKTVAEMARLLGRNHGSVSRHVLRLKAGRRKQASVKKVGRPCELSEKLVDRLVTTTAQLTETADAKYQVTISMVKKALKLKCSERTILRSLHARGVYMHPLREKPARTAEDVQKRKDFAAHYAGKPASFWSQSVDAFIDNKTFNLYLNHKARTYAAKVVARGTFRCRGGGLAAGHVKPKKSLKFNTGTPSVMVSAAISSVGTLMWHVVEGNWNADAAVNMYENHLFPAVAKAKPNKRKWLILEDNDPSGYKSKKAKEAKHSLHLDVLELPRRSPDLNPLDYGFWAEVSRRMRKQELRFSSAQKESRENYLARLKTTATSLPKSYMKSLVESMKRRCVALQAAKGLDFEE